MRNPKPNLKYNSLFGCLMLLAILAIIIAISLCFTPAHAQTQMVMQAATDSSTSVSTPALPTVSILSVVSGTKNAIVTFSPVLGAVDYRIRQVNADGSYSQMVKYVGEENDLDKYGNWLGSKPATSIDVNNLFGVNQTGTYVVEAVDALGPYPWGNLELPWNNAPAWSYSHLPPGVTTAPAEMAMTGFYGSLLPTWASGLITGYTSPTLVEGSNEGETLDGLYSINGQGLYTNIPNVIARSAPFTVSADGLAAIPSGTDVLPGWYYDSFTTPATFTTPQFVGGDTAGLNELVPATSPNTGSETYQLIDGAGTANILLSMADLNSSRTFIGMGHLMSELADGGMSGDVYPGGEATNSQPMYNNHAYWALQPSQGFNQADGNILHVTFEASASVEMGRRNIGVFLLPTHDQIQQFDENIPNPMNNSSCIELDWDQRDLVATLFTTVDGSRVGTEFAPYNTRVNIPQLDDKVREDVFASGAIKNFLASASTVGATTVTLSSDAYLTKGDTLVFDAGANQESETVLSVNTSTQAVTFGDGLKFAHAIGSEVLDTSEGHLQIYEKGVLAIDGNIPGGIPWASSDTTSVNIFQVKYHSLLDMQENREYSPWQSYYTGIMPISLPGLTVSGSVITTAATASSAASTTITVMCPSRPFTSADVDQYIAVPNAGIYEIMSVTNGAATLSPAQYMPALGAALTGAIESQTPPDTLATPQQWAFGMPTEDEIHWDNPGVEVYPCAATSWANTAARITRAVPILQPTVPVVPVTPVTPTPPTVTTGNPSVSGSTISIPITVNGVTVTLPITVGSATVN